jgi:hypothetical protein
MLYLAAKALLSGLIVAAVSEIAKRSPALGALILSLPLVSILAFIWLWRESADTEGIAALSQSTFWFILPTLPMFLVLPALLRNGVALSRPSACLACSRQFSSPRWRGPSAGSASRSSGTALLSRTTPHQSQSVMPRAIRRSMLISG